MARTNSQATPTVNVQELRLELVRVGARESALQEESDEQGGTLQQKDVELGELRNRLRLSEQQLFSLQQENTAIRK